MNSCNSLLQVKNLGTFCLPQTVLLFVFFFLFFSNYTRACQFQVFFCVCTAQAENQLQQYCWLRNYVIICDNQIKIELLNSGKLPLCCNTTLLPVYHVYCLCPQYIAYLCQRSEGFYVVKMQVNMYISIDATVCDGPADVMIEY